MSVEAAVDNDVLIKCSCYQLLEELSEAAGGVGSTAILGLAKYVVANQLRRREEIQDAPAAEEHFVEFLRTAVELEPTEDEVDLATAIEEAATIENVALDGGESQLCAIVLQRSIRMLITGDKRAIEGLEVVMPRVARLEQLEDRLASLEQLVLGIVGRLGASAARRRVCAEPLVDKALAICFECSQAQERDGFAPDGLSSYIADLRTKAPTALCPDGALFGA